LNIGSLYLASTCVCWCLSLHPAILPTAGNVACPSPRLALRRSKSGGGSEGPCCLPSWFFLVPFVFPSAEAKRTPRWQPCARYGAVLGHSFRPPVPAAPCEIGWRDPSERVRPRYLGRTLGIVPAESARSHTLRHPAWVPSGSGSTPWRRLIGHLRRLPEAFSRWGMLLAASPTDLPWGSPLTPVPSAARSYPQVNPEPCPTRQGRPACRVGYGPGRGGVRHAPEG